MFYSQANQDKWVCEYFGYKKNGYFIEVGAFDGVHMSNTYALEKHLEWEGVCIEANPSMYSRLVANRTSKNCNVAVTSYRGYCKFSDDKIVSDDEKGVIVNCDTLDSVLESVNANKEIDYLSIDIEGQEYNVLQCFNFDKWNIKLMTVEHNLYLNGPEEKNKLYELLTKNNFIRAFDNVVCLDPHPSVYGKPYEDWYINRDHLK